ncbi:E3 ubiquitin-protein ligase RNF26 [Genypterus blacodes]|uniref:E3 ubiquitin-protein ligase RNF26 n=1 Tax=Genypterus blacodes TaxID=154954 RepID=UPI003F775E8C
MGLVHFVISTVGKCLDVVCLLLDLNFFIVHSVVQTVVAAIDFVTNLPALLLYSAAEFGNFLLFCLMSAGEASTSVAHGAVGMLGSLVLALEGLLESLKMVGYLTMHFLLRGKEHLYRALLSVMEGCGIAVSLLFYFTNTVVNFVLIATQNVCVFLDAVWQTVSSPLQNVLELTLTTFTFLYSSLAGTSAFLLSPCKLVLDFLISLVQIFISIFIVNIYGLLLTVAIAVITTAYLNPHLTRQTAVRVASYVHSVPALQRVCQTLRGVLAALQGSLGRVLDNIGRLHRWLCHLYLLGRRFWQQLSRSSSQLGLSLRTHLNRVNSNRVGGDGDPGEERRDPPDGSVGDGAHRELLDLVLPSSSTDRPLQRQTTLGKDSNLPPAESMLTLLKEQEERKRCVICQDCVKTVLLLPCRHLCLCKDCTNILLRQPMYQQNCPLCRHMILNTVEVYL